MRMYEIVLDGELTSDLPASVGPITRRQERGATVLFNCLVPTLFLGS